MSNYFRCDVCGRETYGCNIVNSMKFCAKCYQETFGKDNQQNEIQQLKQQLEEKEKEIKKLNWQLKDKDFIIKNLSHSLSVAPNANAGQRARIDELTKIVKEKDKEIGTLKQELEEIKEKAIVPRFKFDEECVVIMFGSYHFHRFIAQVKDDLCLTQPYNDTEEWYYVKPEMVFKTLEEAQAKLKEIQGNE